MPPQEQLCLKEKRLGGQFPVLRSLMFLILICLNEGSPKGIRGGQEWAQQERPNTWQLQTEGIPPPSSRSSDTTHSNHIREGRRRLYLRLLWANTPVIFQFSSKLVCPEETLPLCVVPPCNWKSSIPRKKLLVYLLCLLPGWSGLQPRASCSICQQQLLIVIICISTVIPAVLPACDLPPGLIRPRPIPRVTMSTGTPCPAGGRSWSCTRLSPPYPMHPPVQGAWAETHDMATVLG